MNAPFRLIPRAFDVASVQRASVTINVPYWLSQPWFQHLLTMCTAVPLLLLNSTRTFWFIRAAPEPFWNHSWKIYAWRICGAIDSSTKGGHVERLPWFA